jgi:endonuclease YncB( thermonuclease family)
VVRWCSGQAPAAHADITGRATVIDGDTIEVGGERIRLDAIDAPESAQLCVADGQRAALALADLIGTRNVTCAGTGTDRYGRTLAICTLGGLDLNGWLVPEGWALAHRRYSRACVAQEEAVQAARCGMWRGALSRLGSGGEVKAAGTGWCRRGVTMSLANCRSVNYILSRHQKAINIPTCCS